MRRIVSLGLFAVASCGSSSAHPNVPDGPRGTSIEVADLEVNGDGIDRFAACPPPGDLGQEWYPDVADWSPPPGSAQPDDAGAPVPQSTEQLGRTPTERAVEDTRAQFRSCYHRGLVHDPTQYGHVAIVLRVGPNGRVLKTESWGACELQHDVVACMRDVGKAYRFDPPAGGKDTVIIPVVFQPRNGAGAISTQNDAYTAQAYVNLESMRPQLHECESRARSQGKDVEAWGVFDMAIDKSGQVTSANIDPFHGDQELLGCAAEVMQRMKLPPPDGGKGKLLARITFNPRAGTR
ncbi:MAG TPA: AgmX/PglI C-terminal domain-containing protein [Polyangiaceae bacterium]|nr:AgmX/PglI C-terminal domain-containing protein [Polyangiaceae bacterium]